MAEQDRHQNTMDILEQQRTWKGFMAWARWGGLALFVVVIFLMTVLP